MQTWEERDVIYDVVKKWELSDDDQNEFLKLQQANHSTYDWIKKYSSS